MAEIVDQEYTAGTIGVGWGDSVREACAQGFIPSLASLTAISFELNSTGSTDVTVYVDTADSNSFPSNTYKSGALYSWTIANANLSTGLTKYSLPVEQTLTISSQYCFYLIPTSGGTYSSDYRDLKSSTANPYASGKRAHYNPTTWSNPDSGNADINFRTYGNEAITDSGPLPMFFRP